MMIASKKDASDFIRFAIIISSGHAKTFNTNLCKLIKLILYDNYNNYLSINKINKELCEKFNLEFSENESIKAINGDRSNSFIFKVNNGQTLYSINAKEYSSYKNKISKINLDRIISEFIEENGLSVKKNYIKSILYKYIFYKINNEIRTISSLLNMDIPYNDTDMLCNSQEFSIDETKLINMFFSWNDNNKNSFMFRILSSCFDYCIMNIGKDNNQFSNLFNNKVFYLDANIIFRLAGFNNKERQNIMTSFINKCDENNIALYYTNFTYKELQSTLEYYIRKLKKAFYNSGPISIDAINSLDNALINNNIYEIYVSWSQDILNNYNDFDEFLKFLKMKVDNCLKKIKYKEIENFDASSKYKNKFNELASELLNYKKKMDCNIYMDSIKTDINNYMFIKEYYKDKSYNSFVDKNVYFISTDQQFINWTKLKGESLVPSFVSPSVWYSIMLKYKGRSVDDYSAFCKFLNIKNNFCDDESICKKNEILDFILTEINEPAEIKEAIIYDINDRLNKDKEIIEDEDTAGIVLKSVDNVAKKYENEISKIYKDKVDKNYDNLEKKYKVKISELQKEITDSYENRVNLLKNELDHLRSQLSENQGKIKKDAINKGYNEAIDDEIEHKANSILRKNKAILTIISIIIIISFVSSIIILLVPCIIGSKQNSSLTQFINFVNKYKIVGISTAVFSVVSFPVNIIIKTNNILCTDIIIITENLRRKYRNKYKDVN